MSLKKYKISLRIIVLATLLFVGIVPLIVTGWFLSDKSGKELRSAEGRYQTQLVQDKARQIESFGKRAIEIVNSYANALEIANDINIIDTLKTQKKLSESLKANPNLLALSVKPLRGESISAFRNEIISQGEIDTFSQGVIGEIDKTKVAIGQPQMIEKNGEMVFAIASPVYIKESLSAAVVSIVSLNGISKIVSETPISETLMWENGLPIVFVVDEEGRAVFHPNSANVTSRKPLTDIKIVQEWTATNDQIQSALLPFSTSFKGETHEMIGAYSTANFSNQMKFGVIVMQDERKSLATVGEMRTQVWIISFAVAFVVLLLGLILARQLTYPLSNLVQAAKRIASGDLSHRIKTKQISEIGALGDAFNSMSIDLEEHIENLAQAAEENRQLFIGTVKALAAAIDGKDRYTRGHSERVSRVSLAIGQRMGMNEEDLEKLRISALLHDVGKIAIDDNILKKPAALTDEEYTIMKTHPKAGYKIMKNIPAMKDFLPGMYMHHEMVNGKGYPQGLDDDDIPLQAKIVSVADTFDAMTIDRPYQKGMELGAALDRIKEFVGTRYDIKVVDALIRACADGQIGVGRVKLKNFDKAKKKKKSPPQPKEKDVETHAKPAPPKAPQPSVESQAETTELKIEKSRISNPEYPETPDIQIPVLDDIESIPVPDMPNPLSANIESEASENIPEPSSPVSLRPEIYDVEDPLDLNLDTDDNAKDEKSVPCDDLEIEDVPPPDEKVYISAWEMDEAELRKKIV